jgi:hypothetical protein
LTPACVSSSLEKNQITPMETGLFRSVRQSAFLLRRHGAARRPSLPGTLADAENLAFARRIGDQIRVA